MKRVIRRRRLTSKQAAKYRDIRAKVAGEVPELIRRHHERMSAREQLGELLEQLKTARQKRDMTLADLSELTGMDCSALSKLETGQRPNPTVETLVRYAEAVGKQLVVTLADGPI